MLSSSKGKRIYLTIDDGPSSHTSEKMSILEEHGLSAIFFFRGENIIKNFKVGVEAVQRGFIIGNHSYDHPHFSEISYDEACDQILRTEDLIEKLHHLAGVPREHKWFRFPFLDKGGINHQHIQDFLKDQGFTRPDFEGITYQYYYDKHWNDEIDVPWTYDCREYALFSPTYMKKYHLFEIEDFIKKLHVHNPEGGYGLLSDSSDIVLFHDFEQTHHLFKPLIEAILKTSFETPFCR